MTVEQAKDELATAIQGALYSDNPTDDGHAQMIDDAIDALIEAVRTEADTELRLTP